MTAVPAGHRILPHTADLALEAWAPAKDQCLAQAVQALVESFADVRAAVPDDHATLAYREPTDEDLLVRMLDDVIYQLDAHGRLPAGIWVEVPAGAPPGHADVRCALAPATQATVIGAIPKAVTRHELRFTRDGDRWYCHVTVDT